MLLQGTGEPEHRGSGFADKQPWEKSSVRGMRGTRRSAGFRYLLSWLLARGQEQHNPGSLRAARAKPTAGTSPLQASSSVP